VKVGDTLRGMVEVVGDFNRCTPDNWKELYPTDVRARHAHSRGHHTSRYTRRLPNKIQGHQLRVYQKIVKIF